MQIGADGSSLKARLLRQNKDKIIPLAEPILGVETPFFCAHLRAAGVQCMAFRSSHSREPRGRRSQIYPRF